jgi:hypothetical protein
MINIYLHQNADAFCMHTHDFIMGCHDLGYNISSNIQNYPFVNQKNKYNDNDELWVTKYHCQDTNFIPNDHPYYYLDGRDLETINEPVLNDSNCKKYFKTNLNKKLYKNEKLSLFPSCVQKEQEPLEFKENRDIDIAFLGHTLGYRKIFVEWIKKVEHKHNTFIGIIKDNEIACNTHYPREWCNNVSKNYLDFIKNCYINFNAPGGGGGPNTKKFYEYLAAGNLVFNYVHNDPNVENDMLNIVPEHFPKDCVINFTDEFDLMHQLEYYINHKDEGISKAREGFEFAKYWKYKDLVEYLMRNI